MKICIIGVSGMLGHQLFNYFNSLKKFDVFALSTTPYRVLKKITKLK